MVDDAPEEDSAAIERRLAAKQASVRESEMRAARAAIAAKSGRTKRSTQASPVTHESSSPSPKKAKTTRRRGRASGSGEKSGEVETATDTAGGSGTGGEQAAGVSDASTTSETATVSTAPKASAAPGKREGAHEVTGEGDASVAAGESSVAPRGASRGRKANPRSKASAAGVAETPATTAAAVKREVADVASPTLPATDSTPTPPVSGNPAAESTTVTASSPAAPRKGPGAKRGGRGGKRGSTRSDVKSETQHAREATTSPAVDSKATVNSTTASSAASMPTPNHNDDHAVADAEVDALLTGRAATVKTPATTSHRATPAETGEKPGTRAGSDQAPPDAAAASLPTALPGRSAKTSSSAAGNGNMTSDGEGDTVWPLPKRAKEAESTEATQPLEAAQATAATSVVDKEKLDLPMILVECVLWAGERNRTV